MGRRIRFFGYFSMSHWGCFLIPYLTAYEETAALEDDDDIFDMPDGSLEVHSWEE